MDKKKALKIPVEGSLGLLALGAEGLRAWRKRKQEVEFDPLKEEEHNG